MHKFKNLLMEKLDSMAENYKNRDIPIAVLESACKASEILQNLSTVEAMEDYGDEMSGERDRSRRTGRFVSRDMDGMSRRMMRRRSNDSFGDSYDDRSYDDGGDMETQLEDIANDKAMPRAKRDAARAMLAELRKGDM
jgi:hypothetical protein